MKKYIYLALVLIIVVGVIYVRRRSISTTTTNNNATPTSSYIQPGWVIVTPGSADVKLEKTVDSGLKPQVVVKSYTTKDALKPAEYVNKLIAGARSAIPTLKFTQDQRTPGDNRYTAFLAGAYMNKKIKVNIVQRVYIIGDNVTVMTASYTGDNLAEINRIMDGYSTEMSL